MRLVRNKEVELYDKYYSDEKHFYNYPNETIVRLCKYFFGITPFSIGSGRCLDYGCGSGMDMVHLIRCGLSVDGVEITGKAIGRCESNLKTECGFYNSEHQLFLLKPDDDKLPMDDGVYDFVVCSRVLYYLGSLNRICNLLSELKRVCKPGTKLIFTVASKHHDMCIFGVSKGYDIYEWNGVDVYVFQSETHVRQVFSRFFRVVDVGVMNVEYCGVNDHHYVVLCENKEIQDIDVPLVRYNTWVDK